jgi:hypothetical protein
MPPTFSRGEVFGRSDTMTFECFDHSTPKQVEKLLERFPDLLDEAGHYFAYYGKQDVVHSLVAKGCDLN